MSPFIKRGNIEALMQFDNKTPTKVNEYYNGRDDGLRIYRLIMLTAVIKMILEIDETNEAPTCMRLEYKIVLEIAEQADSISTSV